MKQRYALPLDADKKRLKNAERTLRQLGGVHRVRLFRRKKLLGVEFDEALCSPKELEDALFDAGLEARRLPEVPSKKRALRQALAWLITLFMLYLTLASRIILPIPAVLSYPLPAGVTQLVLMLAVWALCAEVFTGAGPAKRRGRGFESFTFAALASLCAAAYSIPALIVAAWKISAGVSVNIELFFDSAALLPTLTTLGMAAQRRAVRRTENTFRELGLPLENLSLLNVDETKKVQAAQKLSRIFICLALIGALLTLILWMAFKHDLAFAVKCAVCVLVLACPNIPRRCAPTVIAQGVANCASNGTPVNNAPVLEQLKDVDTVIFESHDALTRSEAAVHGYVLTDGISSGMLLALAASALQQEQDGVSKAIVAQANKEKLPLDPIVEKDVNEDSDVRALVGDTRVLVGSYDFLLKNALDLKHWEQQVDELTNEGLICVMVATAGTVKGIITLESKLLPRVCETMGELRRMNIETYVMATENTKAARVLAQQVGADKSVYPEDAEIAIRLLTADKRKTLYVYGGETPVFDVPGLKMNLSANPLAEAQVRGSLGDMPTVIGIARRSFASVNKRLRIWLVYELIALPIAAGALYNWLGVTISPLLAAPLMLAMNVLMIYTRKFRKVNEGDQEYA